ncbi:glycosyltransferase [Photobacterium damselae subsp. piscicida]|uniref:Glycosyltransferase n=1 Tax=Photobacterium damsela subsp. piscicida TaxID=38294 RepID=A0A1Q9GVP9_PHODP|nr:glycosyltransferase [Photobacterium damselae]MBE8127284.1 glycosyltransferase [Photobacterium damselae subsp. piscicida]MDP2531369.1 glycosyltransferase [Photobacterium damselae subsp. piscicida]MDP2543742.1 glycosyltransferase [Photobacterium damselae subsp. piscicida]MDP2556724.1 glycosyltransferase [Photobacterium damselae subsp. piscicida]OLQ79244.1 glycosyl transferase family 2 [Photobacterium damselae subsp. piscicida]
MLVSIITPSYNSSLQILETYESIKNQTYTKWEWLITDDCSTDDTFTMLQEMALNDSRIRIFKNEVNSGAAVTRNVSISNATGKYIAFIDSDDLWKPEKLERQVKWMSHNKMEMTFTHYEIVNEVGEPTGQVVDTHMEVDPVSYEDMLRKKATLGCSTVMIDRELLGDIRMPVIKTTEDYALWLSILKTGVLAYPVNRVLTSYRILPNSLSRNKIKKAKTQWTVYREFENLTLPKAIECFCFYAYRAVFRK